MTSKTITTGEEMTEPKTETTNTNQKEKTMKKIITEVEVEGEGEGLTKLLGETVTIFCACYIYTGKLASVNTDCVLLQDAKIVYETGPFEEKKWKDAQALPGDWCVQTRMIESFGILKV